jgi:hypothetical protein
MGTDESTSVPEIRQTNADRSVTVYPSFCWRKLSWPTSGVGGMGFERLFSNRTSVALEGAFVGGSVGPGGLRLSVGVTLPAGPSVTR